jgi:ATP-dependent helicase HepA
VNPTTHKFESSKISAMSVFVRSKKNLLGVGKLISRNGDFGVVEYFTSPVSAENIKLEIPIEQLRRTKLSPQTRVYYRDPENYKLSIGRVLDYQEESLQYLVRFPNEVRKLIPEADLATRCADLIEDPTEHLAYQINETAFWHQGRAEFVREILKQKRESQGLSALISSAVDLVPHQAAVVRKVLGDPFQRYLLADEVGLGKTIEAGAIVKQYCEENSEHAKAIIIAPKSLTTQWKQELSLRFYLDDLLGESIIILPNYDLAGIKEHVSSAGMIVIDEAHHLASNAWSPNKEEKSIFKEVLEATSNINIKVLLLSATPVLRNERAFLAMLTILDPQVYKLEDIEGFKKRVERRQEVAESMLSLSESESNFFVEQALEELSEFLVDDQEFKSLSHELLGLIGEDVDQDDARRNELVKAIRSHVSDTWRLHRRILRNRRTASNECYLPGRGGVKKSTYECKYEMGLDEALNDWRLSLSTLVDNWKESELQNIIEFCTRLHEAASSEPKLIDVLIGAFN